MPTPRPVPLTPKRPKLSLQTSTITTLPASKQSRTALTNLSTALDSPTTYRNTYDNAFEPTPATPVSSRPHPDQAFTQIRSPQRPSPQTSHSSSSISTASSNSSSPFANVAPYSVALGARSILRNSPLPRRHTTQISTRPAKRMFHPVKRVSFPDSLVEMIPIPLLSDSDVGIEGIATDEAFSKDSSAGPDPQRTEQLDKIPSPSAGPGRRKRRTRDWISRPVEDDVLPMQAQEHFCTSPIVRPNSDLTSSPTSLPILSEKTETNDPMFLCTSSIQSNSDMTSSPTSLPILLEDAETEDAMRRRPEPSEGTMRRRPEHSEDSLLGIFSIDEAGSPPSHATSDLI
ncbi:MAG: hypothetical protein Q9168_002804 [Polycauliona sp. 1 TL-2023]